ncbi:MAG: TraK family protein [Rhodocyclaceae bacterium]
MATKIEKELAASLTLKQRQGVLVRGEYLPAFLAARSDVIEAMAAGFAVKTIWEHMHEIGRIPFRYETFLKYVDRHITKAPTGSEKPITQPHQAAE